MKIIKTVSKNWASYLIKEFRKMYDEEQCDLVISCNKQTFLVHQFIMSACSDYVRKFSQNHRLILPEEISCRALKTIIDFVYSGTIIFDEKEKEDLLKAARILNIQLLIELIEKHDTAYAIERMEEIIVPELIDVKNACADSTYEPFTSFMNDIPDIPDIRSPPVHSLMSTLQSCTTEVVCDLERETTHDSVGSNNSAKKTSSMMHREESNGTHQCDKCGKQFKVLFLLKRHYRSHTGEKPYQCDQCKKYFPRKENLLRHLRIHTNERPYQCNVCDSTFVDSSKLRRHERIHTGERPHECNVCAKRFIQRIQLTLHLRSHTGEKPIVCRTCKKRFTCNNKLKTHILSHTKEKRYSCDKCGTAFAYKHTLRRHLLHDCVGMKSLPKENWAAVVKLKKVEGAALK